ncbi:MAG: DUF5320 domain-containing protein [Desulfobacterales bacterium]|nr:DUF5320 domain-containing protein [Desulfobacterales bacterium]
MWDLTLGRGPAGTPYPVDPAQEARMLKAEADSMRSALDEINRRIGELEKESQE